MLKSVLKKILRNILDKPLPPPSTKEKESLSELKVDFQKLPALADTGKSQAEALWIGNINRLRELVLNHDPREFLRWDVISGTMFVNDAPYIAKELKYLKNLTAWEHRWCKALKESPAGHPVPYIFYPASSGNLIHHAYHLARFEEETLARVHDMDYVFEFGGGYGSMCRLFFNLGFRGKYIIFDLPSFAALQRYYLKTVGMPVCSAGAFRQSKTGVLCLSDIEQLRSSLADCSEVKTSMFLATWSISETPIAFRDPILSLYSRCKLFLITYQDKFGEVNNVDFFEAWKDTVPGIIWHKSRIEHLPGNNYYLIGK